MAAMTRAFEGKLKDGKVVLGADVQLLPLNTANTHWNENSPVWDTHDLVSVTSETGVMVDWGLSGSMLRVDQEANAKHYGEGVTSDAILSGQVPQPKELQALYDKISELINWQE